MSFTAKLAKTGAFERIAFGSIMVGVLRMTSSFVGHADLQVVTRLGTGSSRSPSWAFGCVALALHDAARPSGWRAARMWAARLISIWVSISLGGGRSYRGTGGSQMTI